MDLSVIIGIIILQLAALLLLIWSWIIFDEKLVFFERKTARILRRYILIIKNSLKARRTTK